MIVLFGATGYVGKTFYRELLNKGFNVAKFKWSDYTVHNINTLAADLSTARFVINCAGYTGTPNVDACEDDKANCLYGNAIWPELLARACEIARVPYGHVSSGCIYTGDNNERGFKEEDVPNFDFRHNNCSWYSGTKALGEEALKNYPNGYIWRLRIPFNNVDGPRNYLTKVIRYKKLLNATNSISHLDEFVKACISIWFQELPHGTYNVCNHGVITTKEVVSMIQMHKVCEKDFTFFENEEEFMRLAAKAPRSNCVLNTSKIQSYGIKMSEVHDAVHNSLKNWIK